MNILYELIILLAVVWGIPLLFNLILDKPKSSTTAPKKVSVEKLRQELRTNHLEVPTYKDEQYFTQKATAPITKLPMTDQAIELIQYINELCNVILDSSNSSYNKITGYTPFKKMEDLYCTNPVREISDFRNPGFHNIYADTWQGYFYYCPVGRDNFDHYYIKYTYEQIVFRSGYNRPKMEDALSKLLDIMESSSTAYNALYNVYKETSEIVYKFIIPLIA